MSVFTLFTNSLDQILTFKWEYYFLTIRYCWQIHTRFINIKSDMKVRKCTDTNFAYFTLFLILWILFIFILIYRYSANDFIHFLHNKAGYWHQKEKNIHWINTGCHGNPYNKQLVAMVIDTDLRMVFLVLL